MNNSFISFGAGTVSEVLDHIAVGDPGLFLFFYGAGNDYRELEAAIKVKNIPYIGCMDAGRFSTGKYLLDEKSVVGMSVQKSVIDSLSIFTVDLTQAKSRDRVRDESQDKLAKTAASAGINLANPDMERELAINIVYGLESATPYLEGQSRAGMMLQTVGGSSGGKTDFKATNVISSAGSGAVAATALIRLSKQYKFVADRVSSFDRTGSGTLTVTKMDGMRRILEFNGKPAATAYCEAVGIAGKDLAASVFADYTLGIEPGDNERLITSIMTKDEGTGLLTYNDVIPGTQFNLYKAKSQNQDRVRSFGAVAGKKVIALLSFDCILCYLARNTLGEVDSIASMYEKVFPGVPKIGFGTFSENICGANINQTETYFIVYEA